MTLMLIALIFGVAVVYASVGHGGASGYLAVLALFRIATPQQMATSALVLNLLVAGLAFLAFWKAGHFSVELSRPFLVTSIPAAVLGGWLPVSGQTYHVLLTGVLCYAVLRLWVEPPSLPPLGGGPRLTTALALGAGIGLVSGIVGVGGGIFLSPILVLCRWANPKQAASSSAAFIVLNSFAGLAGRGIAGRLEMGLLWPLVGAAVVGGWLGSQWGANRFSSLGLRRLLAVVLGAGAAKWVVG